MQFQVVGDCLQQKDGVALGYRVIFGLCSMSAYAVHVEYLQLYAGNWQLVRYAFGRNYGPHRDMRRLARVCPGKEVIWEDSIAPAHACNDSEAIHVSSRQG